MSGPLARRRLKMWVRMLAVTRRAEAELRDFLRREHGTTLPRFDVMAALWRKREGVTMSELSRMLLVSNGNATAVVDRLQADGLVSRTQVESDRRAFRVALTDAGAALFARLAEGHEAEVDRVFAGLGAAEVDRMTELLAGVGGAR